MRTDLLAVFNRNKTYYVKLFQPVCKKYSLTQLETDILLFLHNNPQYNTAKDIVELRGFSKSNVSTSIEDLKKRGFITYVSDNKNRRIKRLTVTDEKAQTVDELCEVQADYFKTVFSGFTQDEFSVMFDFLERTDKNICNAENLLNGIQENGNGN